MKKKNIINRLNHFKTLGLKVLVIGDLMLDTYINGEVSRISPEAPVPILNYKSKRSILGGCGNVIANLINLGVKVQIGSVLGDDLAGELILTKIKEIGISPELIIRSNSANTTEKTRYVSGNSQILRLDKDSNNINHEDLEKIRALIESTYSDFDCLIISDYDKGVCQADFIKNIISVFKNKNLPIFIDPKGLSWNKYYQATCLTPNTSELEAVIKNKLKSDHDFEIAGKSILQKFNLGCCLITRGANGMSYISNEKNIHQKIKSVEVYDVSGAGDTVISTFALSQLSGLSIEESLELSSFTSMRVVEYAGTKPFHPKMIK